MEFVCYTDWSRLPGSADDLFARGERSSIFFSRPWFENLSCNAPGVGQSMHLACVVDGGRTQAVLPLARDAGGHWRSLSHNYSPLFTLLLAEGAKPAILECLANGLAGLPLRSVRLEPVDGHDGNLALLEQAMEVSGFDCHRGFRSFNWIYRVGQESFAEYLAARPARLRNTILRKRRRLDREQECSIRLFRGDQVPCAMPLYDAVYKGSWKAGEQYRPLMEGLVDRFSRRGWSRLAVLCVADRPIAAQLWFVAHGRASIFRLAYDEAWKRYSPGSVLTGYLMEHVIDSENVSEVDFLTGNESYKQDWMSERRKRWALICANRPKSRSGFAGLSASLKGLLSSSRS